MAGAADDVLFQSTRPRGARPAVLRAGQGRRPVSIHAPAWGATSRTPTSTPSCSCFNPRARVGRDVAAGDHAVRLQVSIHAPARGATLVEQRRATVLVVSIHAPAWGATLCQVRMLRGEGVSIHAPAWGATFVPKGAELGQRVSIHAPAWGATRDRAHARHRRRCFNPRARVGRDCLLAGQIPTIRQSNLTSKSQQG